MRRLGIVAVAMAFSWAAEGSAQYYETETQAKTVEQQSIFPVSTFSASDFRSGDWDDGASRSSCDAQGNDPCDSNGPCDPCDPANCADSDFWTRERLTNGFLGAQPALAGHGILFDGQATQFYQGVASGGREQHFRYGGKLDYLFTFDGAKLLSRKGFTTILHAETRFGDDVTSDAGVFSLPNTSMLYPLSGEHDTSITGLLFMQALNEKVVLAAGKINVADFWNMVYPHTGRGVDGFMNLNALASALPWLRFVNLSVNGGGVLVMEGPQVQGGFLVFDTNNSTTTSGVSNLFDQGAGLLGVWRLFTDLDGKPGSHLIAGGYSTRSYTSVDPSSVTVVPGQGLTLGSETGAWSLAYYYDQVFWEDSCNKSRNLRLFTGWSLSDGNPSFARWGGFASVEGFGLIDGREQDRMGIAYFQNQVSSDFKRLVSPVVGVQNVQGVEAYYNAAVTPWFHLTADVQVIDSADRSVATALLFGLRANLKL
ncbi:MAG: carbohydrate porin [Planctomycetales bacterium]